MTHYRKLQRSQGGFTLIELVMVIVILGVLAATALPKFVDLTSEARASVMRGVQSSLQAANTMIYAKAAANNKLGVDDTVSINGSTVKVTYGYAQDLTELIKVVTLTPSGDFTQSNTAAVIAAGPPKVLTTAGGGNIKHANAGTGHNCVIFYKGATSLASAPDYSGTGTNTSSSIVVTDVSDCS